MVGKAGRGKIKDTLFAGISGLAALSIVFIIIVMLYELIEGAGPALARFGWDFLTGTRWDPVHEKFGAWPLIYGTLVSSFIALCLAVPLSLGIAIYLAELAPSWLRDPLAFLVELLAAIPSVVYGLWGLFVLVPWLRTSVQPFLGSTLGFLPLFQGPPLGMGMLAAGLVLAIMILPIITSLSREVLLAVPLSQREAMLALGATRWEAIRMAVLPYGRSGIIGAIILGLGRALGETMAVTMVIGNRPQVSPSLFHPGQTIASVIANEFTEGFNELHLSALLASALLLFVITLLVNVLARLLVWRMNKVTQGVSRE